MKTAGIDIGGTQLRAAILDEEHRMIASFRTANNRALSAAENMLPLMDFLGKYRGDLKGVGIGCPGPLSVRRGMMLNPPNLVGWDQFEIVQFVKAHLGLEVALTNDGTAACLAEAVLGSGKGAESVAFIGLSTGVGGGFVLNGRPFNGAHANAAEFWNMIVNEDAVCHKNANPGSLNEQASGSGLARTAQLVYGRPMDAAELFERSGRGEAQAIEIIGRATEALARGIANITCTLDPEVIVVGGSVARYNPDFVDAAAQKAKRYCIFPEELRILPAMFGDDAGLIGASLLI